LKIGFSEIDITPIMPTDLGGYNSVGRWTNDVNDNLKAFVLVFDNLTYKGCIINLDLIWISNSFSYMIKNEIEKICGIKPNKIIIAATHTHSSPQIIETASYYGSIDKEYENSLMKNILSCVKQALLKLHNCKIKVRISESEELPIIKRNTLGFDFIKMKKSFFSSPDDDYKFDDEIISIGIYNESAEIIAILINLAVHPVFHNKNYISSDFIGVLRHYINKKFNTKYVFFLQGFCGDIRPDYRAFNMRSVKNFIRYGKLKKSFSSEIIEEENEFCKLLASKIKLPKNIELINDQQYSSSSCKAIIKNFNPYVENSFKIDDHSQIIIHRLDFNDKISFICVNGEIFSEFSLRLKSIAKKNKKIFIPLGYSNGMFGYIPDFRSIKTANSYEYNSWKNFSQDGPLTLKAIKTVNDIFDTIC
tara:strand:- start:581 stop:1837 length:1257 start_codon:yes stop_codon:yes gene_type:complete